MKQENLVSFTVKATSDEVRFIFGVLKERSFLSSMVMNEKRGLLAFIIKPSVLTTIKKFLKSCHCDFNYEYF